MRPRRRRPAPSPRPGRAPWLPAILLVLATSLVYVNSLYLPFVFDDQNAIVENDTIRSLWPLTRALWAPAQSAPAGRPAVNLSFALNYAAGGLSPWGYHVWNLVVHLLCGLLLFGIVRRTLRSMAGPNSSGSEQPIQTPATRATRDHRAPVEDAGTEALAAACALLWLLHPLQSEVVDYVTQRTESMMGLAYLATLYATIRGMSARRPARWYAFAVAACAAGMACKESMATAPIMVLLYDIAFAAGSLGSALRRRGGLYGGLAACWLVLIPLVSSGPRSHSAGLGSGIGPWAYFLNQPTIILRYVRLAVWPVGLVFDYGLTRSVPWRDALPAAVPLVLVALATAIAWRTHRRLAFLGTWFFVTLAPTSSVLPIATEVGAERRMYLPLAALVVLAVMGVSRLSQNRRALAGGLAAVSVAFGGLILRRNAEYRDTLGLWETVIDRYPHGRAHYARGIELKAAGRRAEAIQEYEIAALDLEDAEYALGFESASDGRHEDAVRHLRAYAAARPEDVNVVRAFNLLGQSLKALGRIDEALEAFRQVQRMQPRNVDALGGVGDSLLALDRLDEAIPAYEEYVRLAPGNMMAFANLGFALGRRGRHHEAITAYRAAMALEPRDAALRVNLAANLASTGRFDEAIEQCRQALEPDPAARSDVEAFVAQLAAEKNRETPGSKSP
jgi:protein O-mannosyl-transferase